MGLENDVIESEKIENEVVENDKYITEVSNGEIDRETLIEVKNVKKTFGKNEVLKGITFSVKKGEVISIIG